MDRKPYLALSISVISVSFAAILIVSVSNSVAPLTIAFYRLLFTVLMLTPLVFLYKNTREELFNLPKKDVLIMMGIGVILAAHFAFWITSLRMTSVSSSVLLVTSHPVIVAPISYYFFKERLSALNVFGIIISLVGVFILVSGNYGLGTLSIDTVEGNILAFLGAIAAGIYILGGRKMRRNISVGPYAFVVYSISTIVLLLLCLFFNASITNVSFKDFEILIIMAFVAGILGHTLYNWSLKKVRAALASVALLGEPVGSTLWAFVIPWISQIPSKYTLFGGCFILLGIYLTAQKNQKT